MSTKRQATNSSNKNKKSKSDLYKGAVGIYLKERCFVGTEKYRKSDFSLQQNKNQFILQKMLENDIHGGNSFAFSNVLCVNSNQHILDQQFGRFSQFVESQSDLIRSEMRRFYGPMISHLYIELIKAREQKAAVDFLRKFAHLVAPIENYDAPLPIKINGCSIANDVHVETSTNAPTIHHINIRFARDANPHEDPELDYFIKLIQTLSICTKTETADSNADIVQFRSCKYELQTTAAVVDALTSYMTTRGHVLILNLIFSWIHVHILDNEIDKLTEEHMFCSMSDEDEAEMITPQKVSQLSQSQAVPIKSKQLVSSDIKGIKDERIKEEPNIEVKIESEDPSIVKDIGNQINHNASHCLQKMRSAREEILKTQTDFPQFFRIADKNRGLTSAHIDKKGCHLVGGFNDSSIHLWQTNQNSYAGQNLYQTPDKSVCIWDMNTVLRDDDDKIDLDIKLHTQNEIPTFQQRKFYGQKYHANSYNEYGGIVLRGHRRGVTDVRFSAHYPLILSVSKDQEMRCWSSENLSTTMIYRGHRYPIWCVEESPTGVYVATGSRDFSARLWSLERDHPLITYVGHTQDVECLAFHPNGNYLASGSTDFSVRFWCVTSGKLMRVFTDCKQPVTCVAFSPDGKMLAAGGEESKVRIFDLAAGSQLSELKEHSSTVTSIAWSQNGQQIASACRDGSLRLWDVKKLLSTCETTSVSNTTFSTTTSAGTQTTTSTSSSSLSAMNRTMALKGNCQNVVKVFYSINDVISCIGC